MRRPEAGGRMWAAIEAIPCPAETMAKLKFIAARLPGSQWVVHCDPSGMYAFLRPEPREHPNYELEALHVVAIDAPKWRASIEPDWQNCLDVIYNAGKNDLWIISLSYLPEPLLGRGLGKKLYEAGIAYARARGGTHIGPDACWDGTTSTDARRVWKSLCRSYECDGPWIKL
jgi:hypothetical protein